MSLIGQSRYVGEPVAAVFAAIPVGVMRSIGVSLMSTSLPDPVETRHGLPGDPEDTHTRYIEAAIAACLSDASICRKARLTIKSVWSLTASSMSLPTGSRGCLCH